MNGTGNNCTFSAETERSSGPAGSVGVGLTVGVAGTGVAVVVGGTADGILVTAKIGAAIDDGVSSAGETPLLPSTGWQAASSSKVTANSIVFNRLQDMVNRNKSTIKRVKIEFGQA